MSAAVAAPAPRGGLAARVWATLVAAWGIAAGLAPHVLHHVGPLAGAALLAGIGGKALFFSLGIVLSLPLLRRLDRRFGTLGAPALAVVVRGDVHLLESRNRATHHRLREIESTDQSADEAFRSRESPRARWEVIGLGPQTMTTGDWTFLPALQVARVLLATFAVWLAVHASRQGSRR